MTVEALAVEHQVETVASEALAQLRSLAPLGSMDGTVRVGVDLTMVADIAGSVERFGDTYLRRIFTPHELATCRTGPLGPDEPPSYSMESLAARFAAKEAVVKVLRPAGPRPDWQSIEVRSSELGWCEIRLWDRAAAWAAEAGITQLAVSLTHEGTMAAAVVVATCTIEDRTTDPSVDSNWRKV